MKLSRRVAPALFTALCASLSASTALADEPAATTSENPSPPVPAPLQYTLAPGGLRIVDASGTRDFPIPECEPKAIARAGNQVVVACGESGIVSLDATDPKAPTITGRAATDGEAVALHVVDGKVWVEIARVEARPASAILRGGRIVAGPSPTAASSSPPSPGAAAVTDGAAKPSLVAPPRRAEQWELGASARAFLPIGNIGFGTVASASVAYRFDAPIAVYGEVAPLGVAGGKEGTIGTAAGHGIVALDTQLFELGLGAGAATLNDPKTDKTSSVSFAQLARIGARDGLSLTYRSNVVVDEDKFELGSIRATAQVALNPRWWLLLDGGGGPTGFAYGDVGIKYLVAGDLGPGSLLLTGTVGGAGVFKSTRTLTQLGGPSSGAYWAVGKSADYAGPALGFALEWRL